MEKVHVIFELVGITIGFQTYTYLQRHHDKIYNKQQRLLLLIFAAAGALLGSRLLAVFNNYPLLLSDTFNLSIWYNQKTIVGALLGGTLGVELGKKWYGFTASSGDILVYPLIAGLSIGRIGCHLYALNDHTFGVASSLPWAMDFGDGINRHPTNLYEIGFLLSLGIGLYFLNRSTHLRNGALFKLFMLSYLLFRLFSDALKPDPSIMVGLSLIQFACLVGIAYFATTLFFIKTRKEETHARQEL